MVVETEHARAQNLRARTGRLTTAPIWVVCHHDSAYESPDIPAANDNASGVAALGEALWLLANQERIREDVEVIFYDAEEYGLYGCLSLLVDLPGLIASSPFDSLYETLHAYPIESRWRRPLPEMLIEVDTVGMGRELHYGASHPDRVARFLEKHTLGAEFDKIYLTRNQGSVEWMARVLSIGQETDFHSLTLDNAELVHTPFDDLSGISVDDVCRVSRFLRDLLNTTNPTRCHTDTNDGRSKAQGS